MRWHGALIATMAGWLGIISSGAELNVAKIILILTVLCVGWGVNQVINDYLGLKEDSFNAPSRPMASGALNSRFALIVSAILFTTGLLISYALNPETVILYLFVFALNIIYEPLKRIPLVGNIIFGLLIAPCLYYGATCASQNRLAAILSDAYLARLAILVWLINTALCFISPSCRP